LNYTIQNFSPFLRNTTLTPRIKSIIILNNFDKMAIFLKLNFYLNVIKSSNFFEINYFLTFWKYFFAKQFFFLLNKSNKDISNFYTNNCQKSANYFIFTNLFVFLRLKKYILRVKSVDAADSLINNLYFLSIKAISVKINKKFYKNLLFFLMISFSYIWQQHTIFFKFYLNFLLTNHNWHVYVFFANYFLHIHNV